MSDLKKILKEEYDKKKLNITPKLLMEMIEQAMFEEKTDSNLEQAEKFFKGSGAELEKKSKTRLIVRVDDRDDFKNQIEARLKLVGYEWDKTPGSDSSIGRFRQKETKNPGFNVIVLKNRSNAPRPSGTVSERFESNIIYALAPENKKESVDASDRIGADFPKYQQAADNLVTNLKLTPGFYFKPGDGKVSTLYSDFGSSRPTPKTDIANAAKTDRISVKKKGGGFLSSEGNETTAIIAAVLGFKSKKDLQNGTPAATLIKNLKDKLSKESWNNLETPGQRRELGNNVLTEIYNFVIQFTDQSLGDYQTAVCLEAMTGNNRFEDELSKANKLLFWDLGGKGMYEDLQKWVTANAKNFKFDIRWRGKKRSAGYRIDKNKSTQFQNKMNELYGLPPDTLHELASSGQEEEFTDLPTYSDPIIDLVTQDRVEEPTDTKTDVKLDESSLEDYLIGLLSEEVSQLEGVIYY
jgi:hypothetical protein